MKREGESVVKLMKEEKERKKNRKIDHYIKRNATEKGKNREERREKGREMMIREERESVVKLMKEERKERTKKNGEKRERKKVKQWS